MMVVNEVFEALSSMVINQDMVVFTHAGEESSVVRTAQGWTFDGRPYGNLWSVAEAVETWQSSRSGRPGTAAADDEQLSPKGREFMAEHYHYALRTAMRVAKALDVVEHVETVEDIVEGAAVHALISVARKYDDPAFDGENVKPFLFTAVRRAVRWALQKHFGTSERRKRPNTPTDATPDWMPDRRYPDPFAEAARREEEEQNHDLIRAARTLLGQFPEIRKTDGSLNEYKVIQAVARRLGVAWLGRVPDIRDRIADHIRRQLFESSTPAAVGVKEEPPTTYAPAGPVNQGVSEGDVWERRKAFAYAWCHSRSTLEVASKMGWTLNQVMKMARLFRRNGVALPELPKRPPQSLIRSIRDFPPSCN